MSALDKYISNQSPAEPPVSGDTEASALDEYLNSQPAVKPEVSGDIDIQVPEDVPWLKSPEERHAITQSALTTPEKPSYVIETGERLPAGEVPRTPLLGGQELPVSTMPSDIVKEYQQLTPFQKYLTDYGSMSPWPESKIERLGLMTAKAALPAKGHTPVYMGLYIPSHAAYHVGEGIRNLSEMESSVPWTAPWQAKQVGKFFYKKATGTELTDDKMKNLQRHMIKKAIPFYESTEKVQQVREKIGHEHIKRLGFSTVPATETINRLSALILSLGAFKGPNIFKAAPAATGASKASLAMRLVEKHTKLTTKLGKVLPKGTKLLGTAPVKILSPQNIYRVGNAGIAGYLVSDGTDEDKLISALHLSAYMTVPIAAQAYGLTGAAGVAAALVGNMAVSLPHYRDLIRIFGEIPKDKPITKEGFLKAAGTAELWNYMVPQLLVDGYFAMHAKGGTAPRWKDFKYRLDVPEAEFNTLIKGSNLRFDNGKLFWTRDIDGKPDEIEITKGTIFSVVNDSLHLPTDPTPSLEGFVRSDSRAYLFWGTKNGKVQLTDVVRETESGTLAFPLILRAEQKKMGQPIEWKDSWTSADYAHLEESLKIKRPEVIKLTEGLSPDIEFGQFPYIVKERMIPVLRDTLALPKEERLKTVRDALTSMEGNSVYLVEGDPEADTASIYHRGVVREAKEFGKWLASKAMDPDDYDYKHGRTDEAIPFLKKTVQRGYDQYEKETDEVLSKYRELFPRQLTGQKGWNDDLFKKAIPEFLTILPKFKYSVVDTGSEFVRGEWSIKGEHESLEFVSLNNLTKDKAIDYLLEKGYITKAEADKERGSAYGFHGALSIAIGPNKAVVVYDPKYVDEQYSLYREGKRIFDKTKVADRNKPGIIPIDVVAKDLTLAQWRQFVVEHELVHLTTGIGDSIVDENMVNAVVLMRLGLIEAADAIRNASQTTAKLNELFKKKEPGLKAFGGKKEEKGLIRPDGTIQPATTIDSANRKKDAERIKLEHPLLIEQGRNDVVITDKKTGKPLANGYVRVVYGDHGPYIELDRSQVLFDNFPKLRKKSSLAWYDEYYSEGGAKLYDQKRTVKGLPNPPSGKYSVRNNRPEGYADYRVGKLYLSPDDVKEGLIRPDGTIQPAKGKTIEIVDKNKGDVIGMRGPLGEHMNTPGMKPGKAGWLGNPVKWSGNGGKGTLQDAIQGFKELFLKKVETDLEFRQAVLDLKGKKVGYYRPNDPNHLQVIQDWLSGEAPVAQKKAIPEAAPEALVDIFKKDRVKFGKTIPKGTYVRFKAGPIAQKKEGPEFGLKPKGVQDWELGIFKTEREYGVTSHEMTSRERRKAVDNLTRLLRTRRFISDRERLLELDNEISDAINDLRLTSSGGLKEELSQVEFKSGTYKLADPLSRPLQKLSVLYDLLRSASDPTERRAIEDKISKQMVVVKLSGMSKPKPAERLRPPTAARHVPTKYINIEGLSTKVKGRDLAAELYGIERDVDRLDYLRNALKRTINPKERTAIQTAIRAIEQGMRGKDVSKMITDVISRAEKDITDTQKKYARIFTKIRELRDKDIDSQRSTDEIESTSRRIERDLDLIETNDIIADFISKPTPYASEKLRTLLEEGFKKLDPNDVEVIMLKFGIDRDTPMTFEEISQLKGRPVEMVIDAYDKAFGKLRARFIKDPEALVHLQLADGRLTGLSFDESNGNITFFDPSRMKLQEDIAEYDRLARYLEELDAKQYAFTRRSQEILKQAPRSQKPELGKLFYKQESDFREAKRLVRDQLATFPPNVQQIVERRLKAAEVRRKARENMDSYERGTEYQDKDFNYLWGNKNKEKAAPTKEALDFDLRVSAFRLLEKLNPITTHFGVDTSTWFTEGYKERVMAEARAKTAFRMSKASELARSEIALHTHRQNAAKALAKIHQDAIMTTVRRVVETAPDLKAKWDVPYLSEEQRYNERIKVMTEVLETMSGAFEEIWADPEDVYSGNLRIALSEKGRAVHYIDDIKKAYFDPVTGQRILGTSVGFMKRYPKKYAFWNKGASPQLAHRPEAAYWNLLKNHPELQKLLAWAKHKEIQRAIEMNQAEIFKYSDLMTSIAKGYIHNPWAKDPGEEAESPSTSGISRPLADKKSFELKKKSVDFDDFVVSSLENKLVPNVRFDISASKYQEDALDKLSFAKMIRHISKWAHPEDPNLPMVLHVGKRYKNAEVSNDKDAVEVTNDMLSKLHMVEFKSASDLASWKGDLYRPPYVHLSFKKVFDDVYSSNPNKWMRGFLKAVGWNKRAIMWVPTIYSFQASSSLVVNMPPYKVPGAILESAAAMLPAPYFKSLGTVSGKAATTYSRFAKRTMLGAITKGMQDIPVGRDTIIEALGSLPDVSMERLQLQLETGMRILDSRSVFDSWYNSGGKEDHPAMRTQFQNSAEFFLGKGGLDKWAFECYLTKFSMDAWESATNNFKKKYNLSDKEAGILASHWINDMIGAYDMNVFGSEGPLLQWLLFARDFTFSEFRNLTGAIPLFSADPNVKSKLPMWARKPLSAVLPYELHHQLAHGGGRVGRVPLVSSIFSGVWHNTPAAWLLSGLWHKEVTPHQMAQLRASYATQAVKAIVWKLLLVNMLQLMNGNGLSINNEEGKKFMVKTNMVGPDGRPVYWRLLQWREGEQYVDMIPPAILPKEGVLSGWSKGLGAELYSKRGVVPTLITGLWSGYDALGHSITSGDIPGEQQLADRAQFFWNTITPEPLDSGRRFDIANTILQVLTPIQISYGISTGATGITADEVKEFRRTLGEEEYRKDAVGRLTQLYPLDDWHWQIAIQENVLTLKQWIDLKKKEDWGAVDLEKRARTIKRKQEFFPVPWMRHD